MIALIYSDGELKAEDLNLECLEKKWIPIAVYRDKVGATTVICFNDVKIAKNFAKRNFPKEWIKGGIFLSDNEVEFIKNKNWKFEIMTYPRLLNSHPEYKLDFEIIDFLERPTINYSQ